MNIFYLDHDVNKCAEMHNDKHCIKMILEYAQLLSTAHRYLDGVPTVDRGGATGRQRTTYILPDNRDAVLYRATHINHPSAIWVRQSRDNYAWLWNLLKALCKEYTYRYGKVHKVECDGLLWELWHVPTKIAKQEHPTFTEPTPAMPDEVKIAGDSVASYRNYYINNKTHLASWRGKINSRNVPGWYNAQL
jgi:hypothetical protein